MQPFRGLFTNWPLVGILEYGRSVCPQVNTDLREEWYEKLQRWTDALYAYERRQLSEPTNAEVALGRMRCLNVTRCTTESEVLVVLTVAYLGTM